MYDTKDFPSEAAVDIRLGNSNVCSMAISCDSGRIEADEIRSVWFRRPDQCELDVALSEEERTMAFRECEQTLYGFYRICGGLWVNRPDNNHVARSKVLQIRKAIDLGLRVPETLITNDPEQFLAFYHAHASRVIIKTQYPGFFSMDSSTGRKAGVYTSLIDHAKLDYAQLVKRSPCLFQEYIAKNLELRITIIGRKVFAVALHSQKTDGGRIDWRRADVGAMIHEPYSLPSDIEAKLLRLMDGFGLQYGAVDMIVTPQGEYVFLEINPNGQFGWIEDKTRLPLYETLADLLIEGKAA